MLSAAHCAGFNSTSPHLPAHVQFGSSRRGSSSSPTRLGVQLRKKKEKKKGNKERKKKLTKPDCRQRIEEGSMLTLSAPSMQPTLFDSCLKRVRSPWMLT